VNFRTTPKDIDLLLDEVLRLGKHLRDDLLPA